MYMKENSVWHTHILLTTEEWFVSIMTIFNNIYQINYMYIPTISKFEPVFFLQAITENPYVMKKL